LPRVATFMDRNPDIEIDVSIGRGLDELRAGSVDAVIAIGPSQPHEYPQERLIHLEAAVVAAPELLRGREPPQMLHELAAHRVLCVDQAPDLWTSWLISAGFTEQPQWSCRSYETLITMYEAAAAGLGITLGLPLFTEGYFASGRLRPCFGIRRPIDFWYSLVYASEAVSRRADMRRFARWLSEETALSQQRFAEAIGQVSTAPRAAKRARSSLTHWSAADHSSRDRRM
jgi:LysR family transcriptional regulator, glycine cleavage system transcriptional activator